MIFSIFGSSFNTCLTNVMKGLHICVEDRGYAQSRRVFKPYKITIYKLGNYETNRIIGMYRFPRSIHRDFRARECQFRR